MEGTARVVCPQCRGTLSPGDDRWSCPGCGAVYRSLRGVADLRSGEDGFLSNRDDWQFALRLNEAFERLDFRGLLERYYDLSPEIPSDLRRRQVAHILTAPDRVRRWLDAIGTLGDGPVLDLGCGSGSFLAAVAAGMREPWGVDIAMRWLLVARKRLDEEGLAHVRLVCACAERLPLRDRSFSGIVAGDVIEHVGDQAATLAEAYRVLMPGGRLFLASPNRYSLAPEPHVQVWGVGYWPRRWMPAYVRLVRGIDFRAIRTLGHGEWTRLLHRSPFGGGTIQAPRLAGGDVAGLGPVKRAVGRLYNGIVSTRPGQAAARRVGPLFHVVCQRDAPPGGLSPTRSTRRRSRPRATPM